MRSNTCRASRSPPWRSCSGIALSASASGTERHNQDGTPCSSTRRSRAATPALRKYLVARMSVATWLQVDGTAMARCSNAVTPDWQATRLLAVMNSMLLYGPWPSTVSRRSIRMLCLSIPIDGAACSIDRDEVNTS